MNQNQLLYLLGDFNLPGHIQWFLSKIYDLLFQLNLSQLVNEPTHNQGNILGLIITNNEDIVYNLSVHPQHYQSISSDHFVISFNIDSHANHVPSNMPHVIFDYSRADYPGLINYLLILTLPFVLNYQT